MWFKRTFFRPPAQKQAAPQLARPKVPFSRGYDLSAFRANPGLVEETRKFFNETALGGHILAVLVNSIPRGQRALGESHNETTAAIELGRTQGFMECIDILEALAVPMVQDNTPPVDYGAADLTDEQL